MILCYNKQEIAQVFTDIKNAQKLVGFVPTMGALHEGHISLVEKSVAENDFTIVSIFVNPTQFNNPNDLQTYPRTIEQDIAMLEEAGCNAVFIPEVSDMYPEGTDIKENYDFNGIDTVMEGAFRPGHFNGVAIIVKRLFELVPADNSYFGLKDFQQLAIIRSLVSQLQLQIKIHACPIIREKDGLAMSSRNMRLNKEQRIQAAQISQTLFASQDLYSSKSIEEIKKFVINTINDVPLLSVEYFEIVDEYTLQPIPNKEIAHFSVGCIAVNVGDVRLIDNIVYIK